MSTVSRDASFAAVLGALLLSVLVVRDETATLLDPAAFLFGVASALVIEAAFVLDTPVGDWWTRDWVQSLSVALVLCAVLIGAWLGGPVVLAAVCWGLVAYFVLLIVLLTGYWPIDTDETSR